MTGLILRALVIFVACLATIAFFALVWPKWPAAAVVPAAAVAGTVLFLVAVVPVPGPKG